MSKLTENGKGYNILSDAVKVIKDVPGFTCEIGLRKGGGSKLIIDTLTNNGDGKRTHIAIDPYGSLPYRETEKVTKRDAYPNSMMKQTLSLLYAHCLNTEVNVLFFPLEDKEFFLRFYDGVPTYVDGKKKLINDYALVFFDGPHTTHDTLAETRFFEQRASRGAVFVYDDVSEHYYKHSYIRRYLLDRGWEELGKSRFKNSYQKHASATRTV